MQSTLKYNMSDYYNIRNSNYVMRCTWKFANLFERHCWMTKRQNFVKLLYNLRIIPWQITTDNIILLDLVKCYSHGSRNDLSASQFGVIDICTCTYIHIICFCHSFISYFHDCDVVWEIQFLKIHVAIHVFYNSCATSNVL